MCEQADVQWMTSPVCVHSVYTMYETVMSLSNVVITHGL